MVGNTLVVARKPDTARIQGHLASRADHTQHASFHDGDRSSRRAPHGGSPQRMPST